MANIAPIVIADGATTPVNHTFSPVGQDASGVTKFTDRALGISIGFPVLTISVRSPSKTSRNYRIIGKIVRPTLEVTAPSTATGIQPAPTKAYDITGHVEFVIPERSVKAERDDILAFMKNLLANANMVNAVSNYETIY